MGTYLNVVNTLSDWLINNGEINEVTSGTANDLDISTHTTFPLAHIITTSKSYNETLVTYNLQVIVVTNVLEPSDQSDKQNALDLTDQITNQLVKAYYEGSFFNLHMRVGSASPSDLIYKDRQNLLYGWALNLAVSTPNNLNNCG